jgi:hypothetical protein
VCRTDYPRIIGTTVGKDLIVADSSADVDEVAPAIFRWFKPRTGAPLPRAYSSRRILRPPCESGCKGKAAS